jgi:hypothetical protein
VDDPRGAVKEADRQANTEDLRNAMVQYRALFNDLLMSEPPARAD